MVALYTGQTRHLQVAVTAYMEVTLVPDAIHEGQWTLLVLVAVLGFLIWSFGLALSVCF